MFLKLNQTWVAINKIYIRCMIEVADWNEVE